MVEFGNPDEVHQCLEVIFGLTRESGNHRSAQGCVGNRSTDFFDHPQELLVTRAAPHCFQHRGAAMLQGDIKILRGDRRFGYSGNQLIGNLVWVAIKKTQPDQATDLSEFAQECGQSIAQSEITSVTRRILPDQSQLADASLCQDFRFAQDRLKAAGPELTAHLRDHAEGAGVVAALRNLQIGGIRGRRQDTRGELAVKVRIERVVETAPLAGRFTGFEHALELIRPYHKVDFGDLLQNVLTVALDQASSHDQLLR